MDWSSFWFVVIFVSVIAFPLVGIPLILEYKKHKKDKQRESSFSSSNSQTTKAPPVYGQGAARRGPIEFAQWEELIPPMTAAEAQRREFDWNFARAALQKKSYAMTGNDVSQLEKDTFKAFMAHFAKHDPLYQQTIVRIKAALQQNGELLQSDMYKGQSEFDKEMARYILYFAEVLGDIKRVKKGRSYLISLP